MRAILSDSLRSLASRQNGELDWFRFYWDLSVGKEISAVCRVDRENAGVLYVLTCKEWLPVLRSMEKRIVCDINERAGTEQLSKIVFSEGKVENSKLHEGGLSKTRRKSNAIRPNPAVMEGNLEMIKDDGLREILSRLSHKFKWTPLFFVGLLFLSNCAGINIPNANISSLREDSFIAEEVQRYRLKYGESYRDPRAYHHYLQGLNAESRNDFDEAAKHFAKVVEYDPKTERFYPELAGLLLRTGQFEEGIKLCQKALVTYPGNVDIHIHLADMLSAVDRKEEAIEHYLKVLETQPNDIRTMILAGSLYYDLKQYENAREMFRSLLIKEVDHPLGLHYLGKTLIQSKEYNAAKDMLRKAVVLRPNFLEAREHLAWVLEKLGATKEAMGEYEMLLKLNPDNKKVQEHLADMVSSTRSAREFTPEDSSAHVKLGTVFYEQALYFRSLDEFRLVVAKENTFTLRMVIAKIYELLGRFDKAIQEMEVLRRDQPRSVDVLLQMALFYSMAEQPKMALNMIEEAVKIEPGNDQLYHSLALAQISIHQDAKAEQSLKRAIVLNDKRDSYYFELGALQERLGNTDEAIKNMKKVIELNPEHSNAHNFLGYIYSLRGEKLNEAVEHLEKALEVQPQNGYFLDSLGWIYFKKGEPEKAIVEMKKAMIYTPPDPVLYDHLGEIYFALKNYEEAHKAWKASLFLMKRKKPEPGAELPTNLEEKIKKAQIRLEKSL